LRGQIKSTLPANPGSYGRGTLLFSPSLSLTTGTRLGSYEIIALIGEAAPPLTAAYGRSFSEARRSPSERPFDIWKNAKGEPVIIGFQPRHPRSLASGAGRGIASCSTGSRS
jgi:hypothetical protein